VLADVHQDDSFDLTVDLHFLPQLCLAPLGPQAVITDTARHLAGVDETASACIVCHTRRLGRVFRRSGLGLTQSLQPLLSFLLQLFGDLLDWQSGNDLIADGRE
jgi:hypothetical protein